MTKNAPVVAPVPVTMTDLVKAITKYLRHHGFAAEGVQISAVKERLTRKADQTERNPIRYIEVSYKLERPTGPMGAIIISMNVSLTLWINSFSTIIVGTDAFDLWGAEYNLKSGEALSGLKVHYRHFGGGSNSADIPIEVLMTKDGMLSVLQHRREEDDKEFQALWATK